MVKRDLDPSPSFTTLFVYKPAVAKEKHSVIVIKIDWTCSILERVVRWSFLSTAIYHHNSITPVWSSQSTVHTTIRECHHRVDRGNQCLTVQHNTKPHCGPMNTTGPFSSQGCSSNVEHLYFNFLIINKTMPTFVHDVWNCDFFVHTDWRLYFNTSSYQALFSSLSPF